MCVWVCVCVCVSVCLGVCIVVTLCVMVALCSIVVMMSISKDSEHSSGNLLSYKNAVITMWIRGQCTLQS